MPGFDLKQINRSDQLIVGGGIVAFIASFLPYVGASINIAGFHYSVHENAWHSYAILGLLFIFVGAGIAAARVFGNASMPALPIGVNLLVAGLAALGTLLVLLRGLTAGSHISIQWGGWILILAGIVETVGGVMNFRTSGEKMAWDATAMNRGAAAGSAAPAAPYPPQQATAPTYPPAAPPAESASYPSDAGSGESGTPGV
jgi:hypothetical protein